MPYGIEDAIQDEIVLLDDLIIWATKNDKIFLEKIYTVQRQSLNHIIERMKGYDFKLSVNNDGKVFVGGSQSNRKTLEEEYPALKKVAEEYDIIKNLVKSS